MPPRPVLQRPPKAPDTALPRSKAPSWFELATQTLGGALGLTPLTAEDYDTPEGGQSIDRAGALGELLSMGLGVGTLGAAMRGPKAAKGTLGQATRIPNPIKAYHGSPHDFDQFSLSKIGTGEGAQAYGHGLYFAENPATAQQYKENLARATVDNIPISGGVIDRDTKPADMAWYALSWANGDADDAVRRLKEMTMPSDPDTRWAKAEEILNIWKKEGRIKAPEGKTYEVNLHASPDELLDWDKPLSEQPQKVRDVLATLPEPKAPLLKREVTKEPTGSEIYEGLGKRLWWDKQAKLGDKANAAAEALKAKGIKGIQYLDQGSRGGNVDRWLVTGPTGIVRDFGSEAEAMKAMGKIEGAKLTKPNVTRNFVIFDDQLIEIAKKYGIPLATAASLVEQQGGTVEKRQ